MPQLIQLFGKPNLIIVQGLSFYGAIVLFRQEPVPLLKSHADRFGQVAAEIKAGLSSEILTSVIRLC